ncbi:hypothetical protein M5W83_13260 [Paenibacillus thiaminolyticus]|uniref:ABC-2 family transporter protein n=1 Tax=Paenibacillus thiaminolyticus TaxID=49283 RepID=A0AAP9DVY0_PANTH|nr:hypothetical protein [Paenibacillus thiaminolyticus]MCY9538998.1 hypothetical protein [Paenibacillus thiaminolyticus]MCY9604216.1 hypothetical protein [Paenibacillus thiaminolyticus]MCY9608110.1 hypothetical protein [Paenibacillus thiaminolyticus]MCY9612948.1 hypothetical protein [Paenibacillus thiaminolyticus]MCY9621997.1 hypothetical protein [Paenibacillus thiaminolyticus]
MTLIGYELLKVWHRRVFALLAVLLLIGNGLFYYNTQFREQIALIQHRDEYERLEQQYRSLPTDEGLAVAARQADLLALYSTFAQEGTIAEEIWGQAIHEAKQAHPQEYKQYRQSPYAGNPELIGRELYLIERIKKQYEHMDQYLRTMEEMGTRAEEMLSVSIFYREGTYSYRNIGKTVHDFDPLRGLPLQLGLEEGLTSGTRLQSTDMCLAALLFLLCIILFQVEKEEGLTRLIRSTRNGLLDLWRAKWVVLSLLTVLLTLLYQGSILVISEHLYGFGDLHRYIQSMPSFQGAVEALPVGQFLVLYLLLKVAANLLFAWMLAALFLLFRRAGGVYLATAALLGISFLCYSVIHPNSYLNMFKYMNVVAFYDSFQLLADYRNLNVFGYPVKKTTLTYWLGGAVMMLLPLLCAWLYVSDAGIGSRLPWNRWRGRLHAAWFKLRRINSLLMHEGFKLFISGKSILLLLLAGVIVYQQIDWDERRFDFDSIVYNRYLDQISGTINEDKLNFLQEERAKYDDLPRQFAYWYEQYTTGSIDFTVYNTEKVKLEEFAKQAKAFQYIEEQRDYLLRLQEDRGITGSFVNVTSSDALFNRQQSDLRDGLLYAVLLLAGLSPLFALDYRYGMMAILRSTHHGRGNLFLSKHAVAYLYSVFLLLLLQIPKFHNMLRHYPDIDWQAPVQSIEVLGHVEGSLSILQYVLLMGVFQIGGVLLLVHVVLFLAVLVRRQAILLLISTAIVVIPLGLQYMGWKPIGSISFNLLFQLYHAFPTSQYALNMSMYYGTLLLLGIGCGIGAWRTFNSFIQKGD